MKSIDIYCAYGVAYIPLTKYQRMCYVLNSL